MGTPAAAARCSPANATWVVTDDNGGFVTGAFPTFSITRSNNGVDSPTNPVYIDNTTFYEQTVGSSANVTFTWAFPSADPISGPEYDEGGCIHGNTETPLSSRDPADPNTSGSLTLTVVVPAGQSFGFYVHSDDSVGGGGTLYVNEQAPAAPPPPAVPEPANAALVIAGPVALFAAVRRRA